MKKQLLFAFAIVALAGVATRAASVETERVHRAVKFEPGGTLRLKSFSGRVNITAADANEIVIDAVRRGTRDRLAHIKPDLHSGGSPG